MSHSQVRLQSSPYLFASQIRSAHLAPVQPGLQMHVPFARSHMASFAQSQVMLQLNPYVFS